MRIRLFHRLATAGFCALLASSASPFACAETLNDAVAQAMVNHPAVKAAEANRNALGQAEDQQFSGLFPHISAKVTGGRVYGDNATSRGLSVTRGAGYSGYGEGYVSLTQTIYDNMSTWNRFQAAKTREESASFSISDIQEDLALRTVLAYLDVLRGDESLRMADAHEKLLKDYIQRIKGMVKEGAAEESMAVQAQDIAEQLAHTRSDLEEQMDSSLADYAETVGADPTEPMPKPSPRADLIPEKLEDALDYARSHHPALQAASLKEQALTRDSKADKGTLLPSLTSELSYRKADQRDIIGGESTDARAVLHLNWEYSVAGGEIARMRESKQRAVEARAQHDQQERMIVSALKKAYAKLDAAKAQLAITQDRQDLNQKLLKNNKAQFEGARMNILQVLQAENALFNARLSLLNDQYRMLASQYAALAGIGRLQESLEVEPGQAHADAR